MKVGLTATPKDKVHASSYDLFSCLDGMPTFEYPYEKAIEDGYSTTTRS